MKKLFLFTLFLSLLTFSLPAQISTAWTTTIAASKRPTNSTVPTVAALTSTGVRQNFQIDLLDTLDNANDSLAFALIGAAIKDEIDTNYVVDVWGLDETQDIVMRIVVTSIVRQFDAFVPGDYRNQYDVAVGIFRCNGYVEWEIAAE